MTSERPHVLPRTVGSWGGGRSHAAVPWGTVRSLWNPNPEPGKRQSSRLTGSQSARSGRPGSGVVVVLTPLPGREKAGEASSGRAWLPLGACRPVLAGGVEGTPYIHTPGY